VRRRILSVTVVLLATVGAGLTACGTSTSGPSSSAASASGTSAGPRDLATDPADDPDPDDAYAPVPAGPADDAPGEDRGLAREGGTFLGESTPDPAATSGVSAVDTVPAGPASTPTTPGASAAASQPTGQGYVDTALENRLPGTPGWQTTHSTRRASIEGWADAASTEAGRPVRLFVSATARTFRVELLRVGWYRGVGARQVWLSVPVPGGVQKAVRTDPTTRMIEAPWKVSAVLPTEGLVAGDYLAKLLGSDGASSFVPLTVRESRSADALVMLNSTLTWQAYNPWGGANTYTATTPSTKATGFARRSVVASYDRPYARGAGAGGFFDEEYHLVLAAERLGLRLNYAADVDLHSTPEVLSGATGVALLGHSEYWSRAMRAALTAARDAGVNLAFLGANDIYRRIRLEPSPLTGSDRHLVNYKDSRADPVKTEDTTADWPYQPYRDPESAVTGLQYRCARSRADQVVTDPDAWVFRGLGLRRGQRLPGLVGSEFDRVNLTVPTPRPLQIMAHSPVTCAGYPEFADLAWYTTPEGAGVFAAGTLDWNAALGFPDPVTRTVATKVTERVLAAVAQPLAGRTTPATDNVLTYYTPAGVPLDAAGHPITRAGAVAANRTSA